MKYKSISFFGQNALLIQWDNPDELAMIQHIQSLFFAMTETRLRGLLDIVPAYDSLTLYFQPEVVGYPEVKAYVQAMVQGLPAHSSITRGTRWLIPVNYDNEETPDIQHILNHTGLDYKELLERHSGVDYLVAFLGFLPGFPYLYGLPEALAMPRKKVPDRLIRAGSVAIGGRQAGIYPTDSPGGWYVLGRTTISLFDSGKAPFCLLSLGDTVRFVQV
jgi:KipI family sensor histidine kinase inhibitor